MQNLQGVPLTQLRDDVVVGIQKDTVLVPVHADVRSTEFTFESHWLIFSCDGIVKEPEKLGWLLSTLLDWAHFRYVNRGAGQVSYLNRRISVNIRGPFWLKIG